MADARLPDRPPINGPGDGGGANTENSASWFGGATTGGFSCLSFDAKKETIIPFPSPPSPFFPWYIIRVNDMDLVSGVSGRPQYITYFDFEMVGGGHTECNIRLFDPRWDVAQGEAIDSAQGGFNLKAGSPCVVQFGYSHGHLPGMPEISIDEDYLWSPKYPMFVNDYQPKFLGYGVEIDIKLLCASQAFVGTQMNFRLYQLPTSTGDVVKPGIFETICEENGWTPCAPASKAVGEFAAGIETPAQTDPTFVQNGIDDMAFLRYWVMPNAIPEGSNEADGTPNEAMTILRYEPDTNIAHMHNHLFNTPHIREYVYARQQHGTILSFRPQITGLPIANYGGASIEMAGVDGKTGKLITVTLDPGNMPGMPSTGDQAQQEVAQPGADQKVKLGRYLPTTQTNIANMTAEGVGAMMRARTFANRATLIVLGDPSIKPMRNVLVIVLTNKQRANGTYITVPHYTSGIWGIESVRHVIQNGEFITQLSLFRNDAINEDGQNNTKIVFSGGHFGGGGAGGTFSSEEKSIGVAQISNITEGPPADQTQNNFLNTYPNANIRS